MTQTFRLIEIYLEFYINKVTRETISWRGPWGDVNQYDTHVNVSNLKTCQIVCMGNLVHISLTTFSFSPKISGKLPDNHK